MVVICADFVVIINIIIIIIFTITCNVTLYGEFDCGCGGAGDDALTQLQRWWWC